MLFSVIEHGMTPFHFQTAQNNSASLCSSVWQLENSMASYRALYDQQNMLFYVLTIYERLDTLDKIIRKTYFDFVWRNVPGTFGDKWGGINFVA